MVNLPSVFSCRCFDLFLFCFVLFVFIYLFIYFLGGGGQGQDPSLFYTQLPSGFFSFVEEISLSIMLSFGVTGGGGWFVTLLPHPTKSSTWF